MRKHLGKIIILTSLIAIAIFIFVVMPTLTKAAWLDSAWSYRKGVTLSRAAGAVTNYQMKILVGESSGSGTNDVNCDSHCQSSFNDLRFTNSNGTTSLDYWIESISGTTPNQVATVWVEFDSIGTSATTFYMYYGNNSAGSVSNGTNTFIFFDDFLGSSLGAQWDSNWGTAGTVANSILTMSGSGGTGRASTFGTNLRFRTRAKFTTIAGTGTVRPIQLYSDANNYIMQTKFSWNANFYYYDVLASTADLASIGVAADTTNYHIHEIIRNSTTDIRHLVDGISVTNNTQVFTGNLGLYIQTGPGDQLDTDWIFVSQWLATEPAWGSWGWAETEPAPNLQQSLVGHWKFDGNAKDSTPYGNDGTVTGATLTTDSKNQANKAYDFNGTTDHVTVPDSSALKPTGAVTIEFWVKPD